MKKIIYFYDPESRPGVINWKELESAGDSKSDKVVKETKVKPEDIGNVQFTSGTTGMPKAAALSHFRSANFMSK